MSPVGERLRAARLKSGLSLDDLAQATKINRQTLEAIEAGNIPNLPRTYYRAFLKSFAQRVGLDPEEILRDHTAETKPIEKALPDAAVPVEKSAPAVPPPPERTRPQPVAPQSAERPSSWRLFVLLGVLVLGFGLSIFLLRKEHNSRPVEEISFSNAVKEQEQKLPDTLRRTDSTAHAAAISPARPAPGDSLVLEGTTTDSLWLKVTVDGAITREYTFPPDYTMHWKAGKTFLISMGNATGMFFTLNGFPVGVLGTTSKPMKNVTLSWQTISRLQQQAGQ
jgi:cytoskeletal protein RodZ